MSQWNLNQYMSSLHSQFDTRKLQLLTLCAEAFFSEHKPHFHDEMNLCFNLFIFAEQFQKDSRINLCLTC